MLAPFEFGQHAPVFNHLRAVSDKIPEVRGERGWGRGEGRGGEGRGGGQQRALCFPTQRMVAWLVAWVLRHGTKSRAGFSIYRCSVWEGTTPLPTAWGTTESQGRTARVYSVQRRVGGRTARVYSVQRRVGGGQREYTRSQNPSYTPQTQNNNICLWLQARSSVVTKWVADRYVLGFAPAPRASTLRASFSGTFLQEGCRKPVLGVCPKSSPEQQ